MAFDVYLVKQPDTLLELHSALHTAETAAAEIKDAYTRAAELGGRIVAEHELVCTSDTFGEGRPVRWLALVAEHPDEKEMGKVTKADFIMTGWNRIGVGQSWHHLRRFAEEHEEFPLSLGDSTETSHAELSGDLDSAIEWIINNNPRTAGTQFFDLLLRVRALRREADGK